MGFYYGSYGRVRGYGPLCRTLKEADASVRDDARRERHNGGTSDRVVVFVSPDTGLCWWAEDEEDESSRLEPLRDNHGAQAAYAIEVIMATERIWDCPKELPGFR